MVVVLCSVLINGVGLVVSLDYRKNWVHRCRCRWGYTAHFVHYLVCCCDIYTLYMRVSLNRVALYVSRRF